MVAPVIAAALVSALGSAAASKIGSNAAPGNDWNYKQHRQLWTERLRFNQDSVRARNNLADLEQRGDIRRRGMLRQFGRSQALADAGTSRNIRARDFSQGLGFKNQSFNQQLGFNDESFGQQLGFNQRLFDQGQYQQGMALNTETAGRAGQRGIAERQRLEGMFPEASPWDLMGTGSAAAAGQAVLPGYPSAQSANNAAGPSPSQQLRASEIASASKMAAMLLPTPAVTAAKTAAHANMYSATIHAMTGLAEAMINSEAPLKQAGVAKDRVGLEKARVGLESAKNPSDIELNKSRSMEARQSGHEKSTRANINQEQASIARSEADHADRYYKGRADYESERTNLGYGQLGVSGVGMIQANKLLNRLGRSFFGASDNITKKLSGARAVKSSVSNKSYSDGTSYQQQLWDKIGTGNSFQ